MRRSGSGASEPAGDRVDGAPQLPQGGEQDLAVWEKTLVLELVEDARLLVEVVADPDQLVDQVIVLSTLLARTDRKALNSVAHDIADRALSLTGDGLQARVDLRGEADGHPATEFDRHGLRLLAEVLLARRLRCQSWRAETTENASTTRQICRVAGTTGVALPVSIFNTLSMERTIADRSLRVTWDGLQSGIDLRGEANGHPVAEVDRHELVLGGGMLRARYLRCQRWHGDANEEVLIIERISSVLAPTLFAISALLLHTPEVGSACTTSRSALTGDRLPTDIDLRGSGR